MSDVETAPIMDAEATLTPVKGAGASLLDRWLDSDPDKAIKRLDAFVHVLEELRKAAIRSTYPSDWIIHTSLAADGTIIRQVGYLQDCGAERAGKPFGIQVGAPLWEREDFPDQTYVYHGLGEAWSKVTGERLDYVEGSRWSGDKFFSKQVGPDDKIDPTDVKKSAWANLHGRAVRSLSGLNAVPLDMLRAAGIDPAKVVMVTYDRGAKGGDSTGASVGGDITVAFGKSAGKRPADLADADLAWYRKTYTENVADPAKAKYAKSNQRVLDALNAEGDRRAQSAAHVAETGPAAPPAESSKIGDLWTRLMDIGKSADTARAIVKLVAKDFGKTDGANLSDFTPAEIERFCVVPDDILRGLKTQVEKAAAK